MHWKDMSWMWWIIWWSQLRLKRFLKALNKVFPGGSSKTETAASADEKKPQPLFISEWTGKWWKYLQISCISKAWKIYQIVTNKGQYITNNLSVLLKRCFLKKNSYVFTVLILYHCIPLKIYSWADRNRQYRIPIGKCTEHGAESFAIIDHTSTVYTNDILCMK